MMEYITNLTTKIPTNLPTGVSNFELAVFVITMILVITVLALRTHVSLMIMVTCAGFLLSTLWGSVIYDGLVSVLPSAESDLAKSTVAIGLLIIPPLLIGHHFRATQSGRILNQILPALFWSVFVTSLTIRFLTVSMQSQLTSQSKLIALSQEYLNILVLAAVLVALFSFMSERTRPKRGRPKKHR